MGASPRGTGAGTEFPRERTDNLVDKFRCGLITLDAGTPPEQMCAQKIAVRWLACCVKMCAKAPVQHLPRLVRMRVTPLQFTRPFHQLHPPLPHRFRVLRSIQGREMATWGDHMSARYAALNTCCTDLNQTMRNILARNHS